MAVGIVRCVVVVDEIPTGYIVDIPVAVVIDAVAGHFVRIPPQLVGQIRMIRVNATVEYSDDNSSRCADRAVDERTRRGDIDVRADGTAVASCVAQVPLIALERIGRRLIHRVGECRELAEAARS